MKNKKHKQFPNQQQQQQQQSMSVESVLLEATNIQLKIQTLRQEAQLNEVKFLEKINLILGTFNRAIGNNAVEIGALKKEVAALKGNQK